MYIITGITADETHEFEHASRVAADKTVEILQKAKARKIAMRWEQKRFVTGRRGCTACVTVIIYPHSIVATADHEKITISMLKHFMRKEFPEHTFYTSDGGDCIRIDADRWTGDLPIL